MKYFIVSVFICSAIAGCSQNLDSIKMDSLRRMYLECGRKKSQGIALTKYDWKQIPVIQVRKTEFDSIVKKSIDILNNKNFESISDSEHINIMRCLNTFDVKGIEKQEPYLSLVCHYVGYTLSI